MEYGPRQLLQGHVVRAPGTVRCAPGQPLQLEWTLGNVGSRAWPAGAAPRAVLGSPSDAPSPELLSPVVLPGMTLEVGLVLVAPQDAGLHRKVFALMTPDNEIILGALLEASFHVRSAARSIDDDRCEDAVALTRQPMNYTGVIDQVMGAIMGVFIGDALGVGVHWQYDLDKLEADRGYVKDYLDPLPGTYHSGYLTAGQLEVQGATTKLLLQSLAACGGLDQDDFWQRFEAVILQDPTMDGTRHGGRYGWTDKIILDLWKKRVEQGLPWGQCVDPRNDTADVILRAAVLAARYHKSPRELCCQVNTHASAQTGDSSVRQHSVAFACIVAGILEGQPLDGAIGKKLYAQCGTVLPFSNMHTAQDYDDRYGFYSEPDSLDWISSMFKGVGGGDEKLSFEAEPASRGIQLYGQACSFWETLSSAYYCMIRHNENFEKAILCSVNGGGSNTVRSSLVGAVMGASVGLSNIPQRFIDGLDDSGQLLAWAKQVADESMHGVEGDDWEWPSESARDEDAPPHDWLLC